MLCPSAEKACADLCVLSIRPCTPRLRRLSGVAPPGFVLRRYLLADLGQESGCPQRVPAFTGAGVHEVCVDGTDAAGNIGAKECILLAVFDPDGGFVTGGGWINSPGGAYTPDPSLKGKANFGFVSKYKKGAIIPTGVTEFRFKVANLNFHSNTYE